MRAGVNVFPCGIALLALQAVIPGAVCADPGEDVRQPGENRWVPSLAITGGANFQTQEGTAESEILEGGNPPPVALQPACDLDVDPTCSPVPLSGDDIAVAPFVGGALELMAPALPLAMRPRFFVNGEYLHTFGSMRSLAISGDPTCVKGPEPDSVCAKDEVFGTRRVPYGETEANGEGIRTDATIGSLVYGASLGAAFPAQWGERQLRIKPSAAWISYEVDAEGFVVNAACQPMTRCVRTTAVPNQGFLRQPEKLSANASRRFHAVGPGLDIEVDTGRFGPIGSSLFLGARAYYVLGNRTIDMSTSRTYNDIVGMGDIVNARFSVEVDPWLFRTHVGIRFQWLGTAGISE